MLISHGALTVNTHSFVGADGTTRTEILFTVSSQYRATEILFRPSGRRSRVTEILPRFRPDNLLACDENGRDVESANELSGNMRFHSIEPGDNPDSDEPSFRRKDVS